MAIDAGRLRRYSALVAARQASIVRLERELLDENGRLHCHISGLYSYIHQCANVPAEVATAHGATAESPPGTCSTDAERMHSYLALMADRQASITRLIQKLHDENDRLHADITGLNAYIHECECVPAEVATARSTTAESLPEGWRSAFDKHTGLPFYWKPGDGATGQWDAPVPNDQPKHAVSSSTTEHGVARPDNPTATQSQDAAPSSVPNVQSQGAASSSATEHGHSSPSSSATNGPDDPIPAMRTRPAFLSGVQHFQMDRVPMPDAPGWGCSAPELYIYVYASTLHHQGFADADFHTIRLDHTDFHPHLNAGLGRCDGRNPQIFERMLPGREFHIIQQQWRQATKFIRTRLRFTPLPMGVLCRHGRHRSMGFAWILGQWCRHYHGPVQIWSVRSDGHCQLCPSCTVCCGGLRQLTSESLAALHLEAG